MARVSTLHRKAEEAATMADIEDDESTTKRICHCSIGEIYLGWHKFEQSLKTKARFFSRAAEELLARV
jgi:hypothetical protein